MQKYLLGVACALTFVAPAGAQEIFSDGFESGHFGAWSSVVGGCGDGTCDVNAGETQVSCPSDCSPPPEWTCNTAWFAANDYCDCECGAWDPDCEVASLDIYNCAAGYQCVPPGVCFIEAFTIAWCNIQWPPSQTAEENSLFTVYGKLSVPGLTDVTSGPDPHPSVLAEVGVGTDGVDPSADPSQFAWGVASPNTPHSDPNLDEYLGDVVVPSGSGEYDYAYRFSGDAGITWSYCDTFDNSYDVADAGALTSLPTTVAGTPTVAGDVIITEIMQNPAAVSDAEGEYFEMYNTTASDLNLEGCIIADMGVDSHTISTAVVVPGGGYAVLARSKNAGFIANYVYSGVSLGNSADELVLECGGTLIDAVAWDGGPVFPDPNGASMNLDPGSFDDVSNDSGSNWCESTTEYSRDHLGTPRQANVACP